MPRTPRAGKPRRVGGSPAARPISRCARAKRVTESISSSTFRSLVPEVLGDGGGHVRGLQALHGRTFGGGHDDHRLLQPFLADVVLDELAHFPPAFADESQDLDVRGRSCGSDMESRVLLPPPAAAKMPMRCPFTDGQQSVHDPAPPSARACRSSCAASGPAGRREPG